jgi:hypothetical protein
MISLLKLSKEEVKKNGKKENEGVLGLKGHIVDHVEFDRRQSNRPFMGGV